MTWAPKSTLNNGKDQNVAPAHAEGFSVLKFIRHARKPSVYAKGEMVYDPENSSMICPGCKATGSILEHGETAVCDCGLHMQRFGGLLSIWK